MSPVSRFMLTLLIAILVFFVAVKGLERKSLPMIEVVAVKQTQNTVTEILEQAVSDDTQEQGIRYDDLILVERDEQGKITALTSNMQVMNQFRTQFVMEAVHRLEHIKVSDISVPLSSPFQSGAMVWLHGPQIRIKIMSVGTITASFRSEFKAAGVNQTIHRVWLEILAPVSILLPGKTVEVPVESNICMAETIIVGPVPDTYLQMNEG